MLESKVVYDLLIEKGISFFTGVPDSLLKDFCAYITDHAGEKNHVIAANEGNAIGLAAGHYLATGNPAVVYMQNSGLGNAVNPLSSLVDTDVYSIPVLLVIGWRGEPGIKDEPQHVKQGKITLPLLETLEIDFRVLPDTVDEMTACLKEAVRMIRQTSSPFALVVRKGTFQPYKLKKRTVAGYDLSREDTIKIFADSLGTEDVVVSTTGKSSRELFEYRATQGKEQLGQDFLTVGSMGHASQIALGIALARPDRQVYCLDGDGALIMHLGGLAVIGGRQIQNLRHVVINNGAHDSVGGQPTDGYNIDIPAIAKACGYNKVLVSESHDDLESKLTDLRENKGPALLEVRVNKGARSDLGRPTTTPTENKENFMRFLLQ